MKCPMCEQEVNNVTAVYKDGMGKVIEGCKECIKGNITPMVNFRNVNDTHGFSIGAGHLDDIKHRKIDRVTGKVYRETNKKIFC